MSLNKKFTAILAVLVVGLFSIFATNLTFSSSNQTQQQLNVVLNLQSGAQVPVNLAPGQTVPTALSGDQVVGLTINGQGVPAGANGQISTPNGAVTVTWNMGGQNGSALGVTFGGSGSNGWPDTEEVG